jgi:hypothetical protein
MRTSLRIQMRQLPLSGNHRLTVAFVTEALDLGRQDVVAVTSRKSFLDPSPESIERENRCGEEFISTRRRKSCLSWHDCRGSWKGASLPMMLIKYSWRATLKPGPLTRVPPAIEVHFYSVTALYVLSYSRTTSLLKHVGENYSFSTLGLSSRISKTIE